MTEKANPSPSRPADAFATAGAIAYGGSIDGFIVDAAEPTAISTQDGEINEALFDTFSQSSSNSSLTVSISGGEAFVFGAWLAIDTTSTVTLEADTPDQTVFIGWNKNASNDVIIGLESAFAVGPTDADQRIPLYTFDTDSTGVIDVTDQRQIGKSQKVQTLTAAEKLGAPVYSSTTDAPSESGSVIAIDGSGSESFGLYAYNGSEYIKVGNNSEEIESIIASIIVGGNSIEVDYTDATDSLTINNTGAYFDEDAIDAIADALIGGDDISVTYDDPNEELTINTSALNEEEVQDAVNSLLVSGESISFTYDDANDTLVVDLSSTIDVDSVSVSSSLTDASGVEHTGELADDGDPQPPESHGNEAHSDSFIKSSGDTMTAALILSDSSQAASREWVNTNADVPNADTADNADLIDGYDLQKDGSDGDGIINFKT